MNSVARSLATPGPWPVDLAPHAGYVTLRDLDVDAVVAAIGRRLGNPPRRAAESALVMGVASRLWAVSVVPFARDGLRPDLAGLLVAHQDGAIRVGFRDPIPATTDLYDDIVGALGPIVDGFGLSPTLLWTNVAASLHAVPRIYGLPQAARVVDGMLARTPLAGHLHVDPGSGTARRSQTCCLYYLVPGAGLCGDCVFDTLPSRLPRNAPDPPA